MEKVENSVIKLKDIKHIENSRLREKDDVADLMHDIEQRGLLEPIGIRQQDNALIFGNRRVKAFEKLGFDEIECSIFKDVSDDELLLTNLVENIKRKSIGTIEIGRICKMLNKRGMTHSEIAERLGITKGRVRSCVACYNLTVGTPFENLIVYGKYSKAKGIPENLIWKVQDSLRRTRVLTKADWDTLLRAMELGEISSHNISVLRAILMTDKKISISNALAILDKSKVIYSYLNVNENVFLREKRKTKIDNDLEFVKHIIKQYNSDLLF